MSPECARRLQIKPREFERFELGGVFCSTLSYSRKPVAARLRGILVTSFFFCFLVGKNAAVKPFRLKWPGFSFTYKACSAIVRARLFA
jgi:hypothetical protein